MSTKEEQLQKFTVDSPESCFHENGDRLMEPLLKNQHEINMDRLKKSKRRLIIAIVVCIVFMILEFVGGLIASSYAIMGDAAHLFTDLAGFLISLISIIVSEQTSTTRFEVIGAIGSVMLIWIFTGIVAYNAILRCFKLDDVEIDGQFMFILSIIGIIINIGLMFTFEGHGHGGHSHGAHEHEGHSHGPKEHKKQPKEKKPIELENQGEIMIGDIDVTGIKNPGRKEKKKKEKLNLNVEAAYLHALGDLIQSIGIIIASIFVWVDEKKFRWMDPAITIFFSIIVLYTTISILRRSLAIVMESTPFGLSLSSIEEQLLLIEGVEEVHDLHIWSLTDEVYCCSCHLIIKEENALCRILIDAQNIFALHGINHSTIQCEHAGHQLKCLTSCRDHTVEKEEEKINE